MIRSAPALALAVLFASPAHAQQNDSTTTLFGVVVDAVTSSEVRGALVRLSGEIRPVVTDTMGVFEIRNVPPGPYVLTVSQYGYQSATAELEVTVPQTGYLQVDLEPKPFALEGLTVITDRLAALEERLRARRNATPVMVQTLGQDRLLASAAQDIRALLAVEASVTLQPCGARNMPDCVFRRGRLVRPRICIDEAPAPGGIVQLASYQPEDFYLVEVYSAGAEIRAYTHAFIATMVERPRALVPNSFAC